jgi:hypothetical protein
MLIQTLTFSWISSTSWAARTPTRSCRQNALLVAARHCHISVHNRVIVGLDRTHRRCLLIVTAVLPTHMGLPVVGECWVTVDEVKAALIATAVLILATPKGACPPESRTALRQCHDSSAGFDSQGDQHLTGGNERARGGFK